MGRRYPRGETLLFQGSVAAGSSSSLVSGQVAYPFAIDDVLVNWVLGTQRTLSLELIWDTSVNAPATGRPSGNNVIGGLGNSRGMVGDAYPTLYPVYHVVDVAGAFLKVFGTNSDATYAHTVDVMVRIFRLEDVEGAR